MDILDSERVVGGISVSRVVFSGTEEEEEGCPCEVSDGDVPWGCSLGVGVQGFDKVNWGETHSCWRRIFFLIGNQLAPQTKVEFPHAAMTWVVGPQ